MCGRERHRLQHRAQRWTWRIIISVLTLLYQEADIIESPRNASIGRALRRTFQAFRMAADAELSSLGMSLPLANVLMDVGAEDGISSAELARRVVVTAQTMNDLVAGLLDRKLVERRRHTSHGRILTVHLTAAGADVVERCTAITADVEQRMLRGLIATERRGLLRDLRRCSDALAGYQGSVATPADTTRQVAPSARRPAGIRR
jgi:DNA-binding MarR family transcriptional regulator